MFEHTHNVTFELSNSCQLACHHKACPLSLEMASPFRIKRPVHLPAKAVNETIYILGKNDYSGEISFHQYNEPLIDPRLFEFIRFARQQCPKSKIVIVSNGLNLSEQLAAELKEAGLTRLWVTRYGNDADREAIREYIQNIIAPIFDDGCCNVLPWEKLDDRITIYDKEYSDLSDSCYAPLCNIVITRNADVGLCCYDWKRTITFGNLRDMSLADILETGKMQEIYQRLVNGDRQVLDICRRCRGAIVPFS